MAGVYFLYGSKDASKNRKMVKGWALKAKGEVLEKMEKYKDVLTEEAYYKMVDTVVGKYGSFKDASDEEVSALGKELKGHWKNIKGHLNSSKSPAKRKTPARSKTGAKSIARPKSRPKAKK